MLECITELRAGCFIVFLSVHNFGQRVYMSGRFLQWEHIHYLYANGNGKLSDLELLDVLLLQPLLKKVLLLHLVSFTIYTVHYCCLFILPLCELNIRKITMNVWETKWQTMNQNPLHKYSYMSHIQSYSSLHTKCSTKVPTQKANTIFSSLVTIVTYNSESRVAKCLVQIRELKIRISDSQKVHLLRTKRAARWCIQ